MKTIIDHWEVYDTRHEPPMFLHRFDREDDLQDYLKETIERLDWSTWQAYEVRPVMVTL
jgi:hypothetical protein